MKSTLCLLLFAMAALCGAPATADSGAARLYYDSRYYAANVLDPDGYSLEAEAGAVAVPPSVGWPHDYEDHEDHKPFLPT